MEMEWIGNGYGGNDGAKSRDGKGWIWTMEREWRGGIEGAAIKLFRPRYGAGAQWIAHNIRRLNWGVICRIEGAGRGA